MFGIGPTELIVILVIALLVLGPKRLPELAAGLGKGLAEFRRATADINAELDEARRSVEAPAREAAKAAAQAQGRVSRTSAAKAPDPVVEVDDESHDEAEAESDSGNPKAPA
jgi:TatA/E family protein of Tat protein translocase